jgi:hypothetical protein
MVSRSELDRLSLFNISSGTCRQKFGSREMLSSGEGGCWLGKFNKMKGNFRIRKFSLNLIYVGEEL